jgi:hypothetical protein
MKGLFRVGVLIVLLGGVAGVGHAGEPPSCNFGQPECAGDCDSSGSIDVTDLLTGIGIALGEVDLTECPSFDRDGDEVVAVNEIVATLNTSFSGCPIASTVTICLAQTCLQPEASSGEVGIECDEVGENGIRDCRCIFRRFDPVSITGIGFVCVDPPLDNQGNPVECPVGRQDCNGSTSVNIDLIADHQDAGQCEEGNEQCMELCDAYCAGLEPPKVRFNSGCESFCQGGERAGLPCNCDTAPASTCTVEDPLTCPLGSCEGKDLDDIFADFDRNDCHCQCIDEAFGDPNPAGSFRCRLGTRIRVEQRAPCDNTGVLVRLPPLCAPLTTGVHNGIILNANEDPNAVLEVSQLEGVAISCNQVDEGSFAGMTMVTNLAFFDSTVGDLISQLVLQCQ